MAKRDIFGELVEGVAAMKNHREGKLMLRSYKVDAALERPPDYLCPSRHSERLNLTVSL